MGRKTGESFVDGFEEKWESLGAARGPSSLGYLDSVAKVVAVLGPARTWTTNLVGDADLGDWTPT